ncbi:MAG: hypothetical protein ACYTDX_02415 [Planctomycetota bacterium]
MSGFVAAVDLRDPTSPRAFAVDARGRVSSRIQVPGAEGLMDAVASVAAQLPAARRIRVLLPSQSHPSMASIVAHRLDPEVLAQVAVVGAAALRQAMDDPFAILEWLATVTSLPGNYREPKRLREPQARSA